MSHSFTAINHHLLVPSLERKVELQSSAHDQIRSLPHVLRWRQRIMARPRRANAGTSIGSTAGETAWSQPKLNFGFGRLSLS